MATQSNRTFPNPILPGFHPDPSICRAGEDYFLVTSSFAYFPGVPLFHSRDLVHWRQIGHCLTRPEQLRLGRAGVSGGIFAPTIRHHNGVFYMVTTNISDRGNFFVTTRDPFGEWSDPVWLAQGGIDPSLYFEGERVYLTSTGMPDEPHPGVQTQGIIQSEIDPATGRMLTKSRLIWTGTGGAHPEGPHLYKIGDWYYLMAAEGGTEYGHSEVIARGSSPWGPWESCPHNPILTHRGLHSPIQALGHADLVEAHDGSWWLVCLGFRPIQPQAHHLGRETFLAPVEWGADGWPQVGKAGRLELQMEAPRLTPVTWDPLPARDDFDAPALGLQWNFLGAPDPASWSLTHRPGALCLTGKAAGLDGGLGVTFVGRRQEHFNCQVQTRLDFDPEEGEQAGLTVWMDARHHYDLFVTRAEVAPLLGVRCVCVRRRIGSLSAVVAQQEIPGEIVTLFVRANRMFYTLGYLTEAGEEQALASGETRYLSSEVAGGFTGVYFALYASRGENESPSPACFEWFDYRDLEQAGYLSIDSRLSSLLGDGAAREIIGRYLPELSAAVTSGWMMNFSLVDLAGMSPESVAPEMLNAIDGDLRAARIAAAG